MSFEEALERARGEVAGMPSLPTFASIDAALRWPDRQQRTSRPDRPRRWLATTGAALAVVTMLVDAGIGMAIDSGLALALAVPVVLLGLSAAWVHVGRLGAQLSARAIWWSYLMLAVVWASGPPASLPAAGSLLAVGCGFGLLAAGRQGLMRTNAPTAFDPLAFRGTVLVSMILAFADGQLLALLGITYAEADASGGHPTALLGCAAMLFVGVWGLSRLRVWAVGLNVLANVLVVGLVAMVVARDTLLLPLLGASALVQLVLPVRMLLAFWRGVEPRDRGTELPVIVPSVLVALLVAAAVVLGLIGTHAPQLP